MLLSRKIMEIAGTKLKLALQYEDAIQISHWITANRPEITDENREEEILRALAMYQKGTLNIGASLFESLASVPFGPTRATYGPRQPPAEPATKATPAPAPTPAPGKRRIAIGPDGLVEPD